MHPWLWTTEIPQNVNRLFIFGVEVVVWSGVDLFVKFVCFLTL